jgi:two-component system, NarL family, nitrate/nitrite response regulator NarL
MAGALLRRMQTLAKSSERPSLASRLTPREREILQLIDAGLANKDIASRLHIELATVKNHVHHILEKLEASRRGEAAARFRGVPCPGVDPPSGLDGSADPFSSVRWSGIL